jgi:hypothetical protein
MNAIGSYCGNLGIVNPFLLLGFLVNNKRGARPTENRLSKMLMVGRI